MSAARGWAMLAADAALGLTDVVEWMHARITRVPFFSRTDARTTRGITGLVYRSIRSTTRLALAAWDVAERRTPQRAPSTGPSAREAALIAVVNGIVGDHLAATGNPLAMEMSVRHGGRALSLERRALAAAVPDASARVLLFVHGSCASDLAWARAGDRSATLARDLGCTPLHVHYNSGAHVSTNGRRLAALLDELARAWPVPLSGISVLAHSMGGLVARSACHYAAEEGLAWPRLLDGVVFLGTPHQGAPLEVAGQWLHALLGVSAYSAPLARLGELRSAGVTDLRHGSVLDEDWATSDRFAFGGLPAPVPLPDGVRCFAIAGSLGRVGPVLGDGLVTIRSALGRHREPRRALAFPAERQWIARGVGHLDLLADPGVYDRIARWLARDGARGPAGVPGRAARSG